MITTPVRVLDADDGPKPEGGPPRYFALAEIDGVLHAGTCGRGLARSADGGATWEVIEEPFAGANVNNVRLDGQLGLLAAGGDHGLFRSTDGGTTWDAIDTDGASVYGAVTVGDELLVATTTGVLSSRHGGAAVREETGPDGAVYRLVPLADGRVAAATDTDGVWLRSPHGAWTAIGAAGHPVFSLAEIAPGVLLAGTRGGGILRWTEADGWQPVPGQPPDPVVHTIVGNATAWFAGTGQGVVTAGADGLHWTPIGSALAHHRMFSVLVATDGRLIAGTYDGLWAIDPDGSADWAAIETGLDVGGVFAMAVHDGVAHAGGRAGVFRSADGGETWEQIRPEEVTGNAYCFLQSGGSLLVGTDDGVWDAGGGTAGQPWVRAGLDGHRVFTLLEFTAGQLLAGTLGDGLWRRPAPGAEWQPVTDGLGHPLAFDLMRSPSTGAVFVATGMLEAGAKTGGIFHSPDGQQWQPSEFEHNTVYDLVETSSGVILGGAQRCRIVRSRDGGRTFETTRPEGRDESKMYCLAIDDSDRLYLGAGPELLRSDDAGDSWTVVGAGLDGVTVFGVAGLGGDQLLAATSSGIYRSEDAGLTWQPRHWS